MTDAEHIKDIDPLSYPAAFPLLEVRCEHCKHTEVIDLALVIQPRDRRVALMRNFLYCSPCERKLGKKRRPDLIGLRPPPDPEPAAPGGRRKKAS